MLPIESLHNHTTLSDGKLSHQESFRIAQELGYSVFAFTDHDALPDKETLEFLENMRGEPMKWVIGIEITAALPPEAGGRIVGDFHIIGLFVDPHDVALRAHCTHAQLARVERMKGIVRSLRARGFLITEEDCLRASGGESVGRPHIVEALRIYPENILLMAQMKEEMRIAGKSNLAIQEKYDAMMAQGEHAYPYALFLSPDAFRPSYVGQTYVPTMDEAVRLIRNAGGVALIAHYFTVNTQLSLDMISRFLETNRIDGMELVYRLGKSGGETRGHLYTERTALGEIVRTHRALWSGGSDAHSEEDLRRYQEDTELSRMSGGMTAQLIDSGRVQKRWSSVL